MQVAACASPAHAARIARAPTPAAAWRLGRAAPERSDWPYIRLEVMRDLLRQRFADPERARRLLATGDAELVHGNPWRDTFWGVWQGVGENHLGRLLMALRDELRRAASPPAP